MTYYSCGIVFREEMIASSQPNFDRSIYNMIIRSYSYNIDSIKTEYSVYGDYRVIRFKKAINDHTSSIPISYDPKVPLYDALKKEYEKKRKEIRNIYTILPTKWHDRSLAEYFLALSLMYMVFGYDGIIDLIGQSCMLADEAFVVAAKYYPFTTPEDFIDIASDILKKKVRRLINKGYIVKAIISQDSQLF